MIKTSVRHDWQLSEVMALYELPLLELLYQAQTVHRQYFKNSELQLSTLYNFKTGACPEDCGYCTQSRHHNTDIQNESMVPVEKTLEKAREAKANGATRFCMGAAWRSPKKHQMPAVIEMIKGVKALGLETCATLGMLTNEQAQELKEAGLDYYNHNLDTSREYYAKVATTRTYDDRLNTLQQVRDVGLKVCCGGILGMGEQVEDRISLLIQLAQLNPHPESVPINHLHPVPGTPLGNSPPVPAFDFIKIIALARIMMPTTRVRLTAGRLNMSETMQTLCFMAGANAIFIGSKLLTVPNPEPTQDEKMMAALGFETERV